MSKIFRNPDPDSFMAAFQQRLKRLAIVIGVPLIALLVVFLLLWNVFFRYVPPGHMLVVISKFGKKLDPERVLAEKDEMGVQREVLGEGWHFITPIIYTTEVRQNTTIEPGKVGIVTARGGKTPPDGKILTDDSDEKGIRRHVLTPGSYRINPYGYDVEQVDAVMITPGFVGVQRRRLGKDSPNRFADNPEEKGILRETLHPGMYFINTKEYEVVPREVGIYQTSYHYDEDATKNTGISFKMKDGNTITLDCTIEWEILPKHVPELASHYQTLREIEKNVIDLQAGSISQNRGLDYGAQDFLEGDKREKFQADFRSELIKACEAEKIQVHSAYIRNIVLPDQFLKPKRDRQLFIETKVTNEAKQETAKSDAAVEMERSEVEKSVQKVKAETISIVANIDQSVDNLDKTTIAEIEQLKSTYAARIADLEAQRKLTMGSAEANVVKLKETAKSSIYKMKLDVFQNDGNAFLRYSLAEQLNPKLSLRLFHAGPGTFWTNMGDKTMNLMLSPMGHANEAKAIAEPSKPKDKN
jgi:SPFH domain / Band 7 family